MMVKVNITDRAHTLLRAQTDFGFAKECKQLPDGTWNIELRSSTLKRARRAMLPGETISDLIERMVGIKKGLN